MRITCVIDNLGSGGAQRQLVTLGIAFKRRGHDVRFLTYHKDDFFAPMLEAANIEIDQVVFVGSAFELYCRSASGRKIIATVPASETAAVNAASRKKKARLGYDPAAVHLIAAQDAAP